MRGEHLVRIGVLGWVGRFRAADAVCYPRHTDVIVRTERGLEVGQVVAPLEQVGSTESTAGSIVRRMTAADRLLAARLTSGREAAMQACSALLAEQELDAALLDVEHLFDGRSVYFYYLGEVSPAVAAMTDRLAETYEAEVNFRKFTEVLEEGCGPGCGSQSGGASCGSCSAGCALAGTCTTRDG